jgi:hypothetical protein
MTLESLVFAVIVIYYLPEAVEPIAKIIYRIQRFIGLRP